MSEILRNRQSIRLDHYDYSTPGAYFFTAVVSGRTCLFGQVKNDSVDLTPGGEMIWDVWRGLPGRFPGLNLDAFVVMPDHVHGIVRLETALLEERYSFVDVIHAFKSLSTSRYIKGVRNGSWPPFYVRLWQRNYHESILRNAVSAEKAAAYIKANPERWDEANNRPLQPFNPGGSDIKF